MQQPSEKVFTKVIEVQESDLDQMQHVNNVKYVQWIQDIASSHWQSVASNHLQEKYAWVVTTHHINYKSPAFLGDKICLRTYVKKSSGVTSIRIVEMYHNDTNKLLVNAETSWCLLLRDTLKPCRIPDEISVLFSEDN
ncbi:acyl-CoA thioesterase [Flavobacteriaceae bacterium M23B6Z8]